MSIDLVVNNILLGETADGQIDVLVDEGITSATRRGFKALSRFAKNKSWKARAVKLGLVGAGLIAARKVYVRAVSRGQTEAEHILVRVIRAAHDSVGKGSVAAGRAAIGAFARQHGLGIIADALMGIGSIVFEDILEMPHDPTDREIRRIVHRRFTQLQPGGTHGLTRLRQMVSNPRTGSQIERLHRDFMRNRAMYSRISRGNPLSLFMLQWQDPIAGGLLNGISPGALTVVWIQDMQLELPNR